MPSSAGTVEQKALVFDSPDDRRLIAVEAAADPAFARKLSRMLSEPDGERQVVMYARKAVVNELDPSLYRETAGQWPKLRSAVARLVVELPFAITDAIDRMPLEARTKALEQMSKIKNVGEMLGLGDLGQWEIIGQLVGAVAGAATSIYNTKLQNDTAKQIANMQLQANEQAIQAQIAQANAAKAIANAQTAQALQQTLPAPLASAAQSAIAALPSGLQAPVASIVGVLSTDIGGGVPIWMVILGIYLSTKMK